MGVEEETVLTVARLMAVSARTAPKAKGMDSIEVKVAGPGELGSLAAAMKDMGERLGYSFFVRDAGNISASDGCLLVGVRGHEPVGINCGGCGYANCSAMTAALAGRGEVTTPFYGPNCVVKMADLGIAVGSAARTAAMHTVDNRVMYSAGAAALSLG
jgi:uncharacterized ferredoxin-like protein